MDESYIETEIILDFFTTIILVTKEGVELRGTSYMFAYWLYSGDIFELKLMLGR